MRHEVLMPADVQVSAATNDHIPQSFLPNHPTAQLIIKIEVRTIITAAAQSNGIVPPSV